MINAKFVHFGFQIINPVYEEHKAEFNPDQVLDFLDVYLREMKAHQNVEKTTIEGMYICNYLFFSPFSYFF